ncbi:Protein phosphatase 1 regulatory subunit 16A [Oopsacas minuta]|uniref:Protein phosphatase 1 regulatory subunit 16A n=1 Tax=Oopsacas minuta TaxID=111878 RepID=A0AAV7K3E2_9METZ|nr:Protein phosphatase 1 regulatory subunit 16A [Oopsacas minuta]
MASKKTDFSSYVAMTHEALVSEIPKLDRMSQAERLKHNRRRREKQIKKWKEVEEREFKKHLGRGAGKKGSATQLIKNTDSTKKQQVDFISQSKLFDFVSKRTIRDMKAFLDKSSEEDQVSLIGSINHHGMTALHKCVAEGATKIAEELISRGADVNIGDKDQWTPLHAAAFIGDLDMVDLFVASNANLMKLNLDLQTCLDLTEAKDVKEFLKEQFARENITEEMLKELKDAPSAAMLSEADSLSVEELNKGKYDNGATLLHIAASNGFNEVVDTLLKKGIDLEVKDEDGWTALHAAVYWGQESTIAKLLLGEASFNAETNAGEDVLALAPNNNLKERIESMFTDYSKEKAKQFFESIDSLGPRARDARSSSIMAKQMMKSPEKRTEDQVTNAMIMGTNLGLIDEDDDTFNLYFNSSVDISDPYLRTVYGDNYDEPKRMSLSSDSMTSSVYSLKQSSRECIFASKTPSTPLDDDEVGFGVAVAGTLGSILERATEKTASSNLNSTITTQDATIKDLVPEPEDLTPTDDPEKEPTAAEKFATQHTSDELTTKTQSLDIPREQTEQQRSMSDIPVPKRGKAQTSLVPRSKEGARNKQTKRGLKSKSKVECTIF